MNKCPACVEQGLKSRLYESRSGGSTCMGYQDYYDEEGRRHSHDPNTFMTGSSCSNGHKIHLCIQSQCPSCDYNKGESTAYIEGPGIETRDTYKLLDGGWVKQDAVPQA